MASRKKIKIELSEDDLADLLGYWSKGESIPIEVEVTEKGKVDRGATYGPGGFGPGDLIRSSERWLEEEGLVSAVSGDELEVSLLAGQVLCLTFDEGKSATIRCRSDLTKNDLGWLRRLEKEELSALVDDIDMVLALRPSDSKVIWQSGLPSAIEVSCRIYADGFTKDRLMSALSDVSRSARLAHRVVRIRSGMTSLDRQRAKSRDFGI